MKRHPSLIALSHDHHHGLLLAQLIKKGAPKYEGLPKDIKGKVEHVKQSWDNELKLHFENEEKILFPAVKGKEKELDKLITEILDEHIKIKLLVKSLDESKNIEDTLNELGIALEQHIRKEERQVFQKIQNLFSEELDGLVDKIEPVKKSC
jgi:iron-sulfur cluster repair protein YtfE (RIC family)